MDGLILAGGKSTRMDGRHKGSLIYRENSFTQILIRELRKEAESIWLSYGRELHEIYEGCEIVTDIYPDCGPIGGIHAGLTVCKDDVLMAAACDMPFLKIEIFRYLYQELKRAEGQPDGVVPITDGRIHPLAAIYRKSAVTILEAHIKDGNYRLRDALKRMNILYVDVSENREYTEMLRNINTVEEYEELKKRG